jgi:hypothetical protein
MSWVLTEMSSKCRGNIPALHGCLSPTSSFGGGFATSTSRSCASSGSFLATRWLGRRCPILNILRCFLRTTLRGTGMAKKLIAFFRPQIANWGCGRFRRSCRVRGGRSRYSARRVKASELIFIQEELNNFTWFSGIGECLVSNDNVLNLETIKDYSCSSLEKEFQLTSFFTRASCTIRSSIVPLVMRRYTVT